MNVYVPEGTWTSLLTGEQVTGPRWFAETHDFLSLPVYVRPDTVLPVGAREDRPDYAWADGVTLRLFELADGHRSVTTVPVVGRRRADDVRRHPVRATRYGVCPRRTGPLARPGRAVRRVGGRVVDADGDQEVELAL